MIWGVHCTRSSRPSQSSPEQRLPAFSILMIGEPALDHVLDRDFKNCGGCARLQSHQRQLIEPRRDADESVAEA
ncbi:hypothetical protein AND_006760 [Anopheles darlingi]|nr:hypothetical protein AND_006760 [Anopheles darlingi]